MEGLIAVFEAVKEGLEVLRAGEEALQAIDAGGTDAPDSSKKWVRDTMRVARSRVEMGLKILDITLGGKGEVR